MGERREDPRGVPPEEVRSPRVVLVMVECLAADEEVEALQLGAEAWAHEVRYRSVGAAETRNAGAVVVDGNFATVGAMLALASEAVTRA